MRSGGGDERILSRHLANEQQSTFRGIGHQNDHQPFGGGNGGHLDPAGGRTPQMGGNLTTSSLRRSMPSVNSGHGGHQKQWGPTNRHLSISVDPQQDETVEEDGGEGTSRMLAATSGNDAGTWPKGAGGPMAAAAEYNSVERAKRCTSAHSYTSLSPSGSLIFTTSQSFGGGGNSAAMAPIMAGGGAVDTRQIQVVLRKQREDSRATISTTLSMESADVGAGAAAMPPMISSSSSSAAASGLPAKNAARKVFRSMDTRSSIFSVSSSLDSTKEERIMSNLEHITPTATNRVVVLPRPTQPTMAQQLQVDWGGGGEGETEEGMERIRSNSAEVSHRQQSSSSSSSFNARGDATVGRRTSVDSKTASLVDQSTIRGGGHTPPPPAPSLLSSWHSIADLTSAGGGGRLSADDGEGGERRRRFPSGGGDGHRIDAIGGGGGEGGTESPNIWHSPPPPRPQSQASNRRSNYLGELVWQVDETVYCGGIEAAQNQNLLCRLNIEYIVDLSGQEDDPSLANSRPRTEYPCLCPKRTAHSRMTMSIRVKDDSQQMLNRDTRPSTVDTKAQMMEREEIIHYFEALIDLIRKARISQKKVLIHSLKGRNRAPAFVAAYLMHCNRQTRVQAINKISKMMSSMRPGTCISDTLQRALMRWQSILGIRAESTRFDAQQLNKMFSVKKTAWN